MKEYEMPKKISQRNLLLSYTPPDSPNHLYNNVANISDEINDNITENIPENNNLLTKLSQIYKNRKKSNYARVLLHLLLHIILLSIFEIFLFFNFVVIMEKKAFIDKLEEYFKNTNNLNISQYLIPYINYELNNDESNNWYNHLENQKDQSIDQYDEDNNKLRIFAWHGTFLLAGFLSFYILSLFMFYKLGLKKLILEHAILISLIGVYEYWFFTNIILPYKIISADELNYIVISCMLKKLNSYNGININATITDECNIL